MEEKGDLATTRMRKDGAVVIPAHLRRRFGFQDGIAIVAEARNEGGLLRAAGDDASTADRHQRMLEEADRADAALRADPDAWREELAERAVWDVTNLDGLAENGWWTDEGEPGGTTVDSNDGSGPRRNSASRA